MATRTKVDGKVLKVVQSIKSGEPELNVRRFQRLCSMLRSHDHVHQVLREHDKYQLVQAALTAPRTP